MGGEGIVVGFVGSFRGSDVVVDWKVRMRFGLVSNCFRCLLDADHSLEDLIAHAANVGYRVIELRQGFMGRFESNDTLFPNAEALAELPIRFPEMHFNIAINIPFLSGRVTATDPLFVRAKQAAVAIAGRCGPHLRLVDTDTTDEQVPHGNDVAERLSELVYAMRRVDGVLSVEHAMQSWTLFESIFNAARDCLGEDRSCLKLCFDPCNLLMAKDGPDPIRVARGLSCDALAMVHIKQRHGGVVTEDVSHGELDWPTLFKCLHEIGFKEPYLFEVAPSMKLWSRLEQSARPPEPIS